MSGAATRSTAWDDPQPPGPPPRGEGRADVAVVGAGVVGLSLATMLAEQGLDVTVVARHPVGEGVSGRSTAKVTSLHQTVYADLARRHGADAAATYAAACQDAVAWIRRVGGDTAADRDAVTVAADDAQVTTLREEAAAAEAAGLPVRLEGAPPGWPSAPASLRLPEQAQVEPVAFLRRLAGALPAGSAVLHGTATGVRERPGGAVVHGDGWSVRARHVVVATGLPILDRGAYFALAEPKASYIIAYRQDPAEVPDGQDMMISAGSPTRSLRWHVPAVGPHAGQPVVLVGGEGHRTGASHPTAERYARLETWARSHLGGLGAEVARWSAEDFASADRLPFAGPHLRIGGPVHVVTGLSKWGWTLGVACAAALTARIAGDRTTPFGHLVDPARFPDLQGARTAASANAQVARHLAARWAGGLLRRPDPAPAEGTGTVGRCGLLPCGIARSEGTTHRVSAICTHLGGIVSFNDADRTWDCPLHGSRFEVDGGVRHGPAVRPLRDLR